MTALVCEPIHLTIEHPINSFQAESLAHPPDRRLARRQHARMTGLLERLGVPLLRVRPLPEAPYQVFVRDVLVGGLGTPILARLREPVRRPETEAVRRALVEASIPFVESEAGYLEGGDVVVAGDEAFVGVGDRTERSAAAWLRERCAGEREVHLLEMRPGFLHLDMVFNVLGRDACVFHPAAFEPESAAVLTRRFRCALEIGAAEQRRMSTNFLPVGESAAICSTTVADEVAAAGAAAGRVFHRVELGELQKAGGSVRCATCLV